MAYNKNYKKNNGYSRESSFDNNEFFDLALKRSYGEIGHISSKSDDKKSSPRYYVHKSKPVLKGKLAKLTPTKNDFMRFASGEIYPQRQDLPAALHASMYKGNRKNDVFTMKRYYRHSLELAKRHGSKYKPLNKDDLAYALATDVKNRGSSALDDYYRYEKELSNYGVNINGKWTGGKFGSGTGST